MEGVYVVELSTGVVKIGRSGNLAARIKVHAETAQAYGVEVVQIWSAPVQSPVEFEARILRAISRLSDAVPVVGSSEFLTHVSFLEAIAVARDVAKQQAPTMVEVEPQRGPDAADLLGRLQAAGYYDDWDARQLGVELTKRGVARPTQKRLQAGASPVRWIGREHLEAAL